MRENMELITVDENASDFKRILAVDTTHNEYAAVLQRSDPSAHSYTRYADIQKYRTRGAMPEDFKGIADLVWPYYKFEDQTNTTINMMVDFVCKDNIGTVVLQSGEETNLDIAWMADIVKNIRQKSFRSS